MKITNPLRSLPPDLDDEGEAWPVPLAQTWIKSGGSTHTLSLFPIIYMVASQKVEGSSSLETCHLIGVYAYDLTLNDEDEA